MAKHALCVFDGNTVNEVRTYLNTYTGPDTFIRISKDGKQFYILVEDGHGNGGEEDNSHPCPGSPNCS